MADAAAAPAGNGAIAPAEGEQQPVSFTDANHETGQTGANGDAKKGASAMLNLIGDIKKKQGEATGTGTAATQGATGEKSEAEETSGNKTTAGGKKKKKKKKKDKKKGKGKGRKKIDKFEPQNYLLRIEGSICCATLVMVGALIGCNAIMLIFVLFSAGSQLDHVFYETA